MPLDAARCRSILSPRQPDYGATAFFAVRAIHQDE
jgi:hypothetical protein